MQVAAGHLLQCPVCRHLNGCLLDAVSRPHLLITDAFNADYVQARRMQRDEQLLSMLINLLHFHTC